MKPIRLQFVSSPDAVSRIIELMTHGMFSHVDAVLEDGTLLGARYDGGVAIRPPDYETFKRKILVEIPTTDEIADDFYSWLKTQLGKEYDVQAVAAYAFGRDWRETDAWYCSELIAAGLERKYFQHQLISPTSKIDPWDLVLVLSALVKVEMQ